MSDKKYTGTLVNEQERIYLRKSSTYTERFDLLMKLIRLQRMMKTAIPLKKP
ncbi:MAG: hypothetical protein WC760_06895 [Bacteroidia bacterium]|jgi:hypothetical protein